MPEIFHRKLERSAIGFVLAVIAAASVGGIVEGVVAKATELQGTAQAMAATAEETSRQSTAVAATSVQTTQSV